MPLAYVRYVENEIEGDVSEATGAIGEMKTFVSRKAAQDFIDDHAVDDIQPWRLCKADGTLYKRKSD